MNDICQNMTKSIQSLIMLFYFFCYMSTDRNTAHAILHVNERVTFYCYAGLNRHVVLYI